MEKEQTTPPTWYVYMIENRLAQLYTGVTTDPNRRLRQHRGELKGGARALKGKAPLSFKWVAQASDKASAMRTEYHIKRLSKSAKLALLTHPERLPEQVSLCTAEFSD